MSGKWIAILLVIVAAGVVVAVIIANSNGEEEASDTGMGEIKGWTWDGELVRGAIREGKGVWKPFYK